MVKAKQDRRKRDIKSKLMAAIAMLLVSSIMMVSSTYAWFTLSTAPEVTGISTAVGANGNLEIALLTTTTAADTTKITSAVGDSMNATDQTVQEANITWGNLVALANGYGLDQITLFPSALNGDAATIKDADGNLIKVTADNFLQTPLYGFDGRVSELRANTVASLFVPSATGSNTGSFPATPVEDARGVRAIGVASGMTEAQIAFRNARSNASTAIETATRLAAASLEENGSALASIAVQLANGAANAEFYKEDLDAMQSVIDDLNAALASVEKAYINYIYALTISKEATETALENDTTGVLTADTYFATMSGYYEDNSTNLANYLAALSTAGITLDTNITNYVANLNSTKADVATAQTKLTELVNAYNTDNSKKFTWGEFSPVVTALADPTQMTVGGYKYSEIKANLGNIVNQLQDLRVVISTGGGVFADVADHCGDYSAHVKVSVEYSGTTMNLDATMETKTSVAPNYLSLVGTAVQAAGAPESSTDSMPLSDFYGYVIDLAFRTNAANSNLLLQTEAVDRIYEGTSGVTNEDTGDTTMGGGSTMEFTVADASLGKTGLTQLADAIRIIFFDPDTGDVYATAGLDSTGITGTATSYELPIYLYEYQANSTTTYVAATYAADSGLTYYTRSGDAESYTYTAIDDTTASTSVEQLYTASTASGDPQKTKLENNDAIITALTQNQAQKVSVLVYLDGENITNASVAATAATSMSGKLNLQFASSANLDPMDYADLMGQTTGGEGDGN